MLTASAAAVLITSPAEAQQASSWEGLYAGVHAGYGWGDTDSDCSITTPGAAGPCLVPMGSFETDGAFGGGQIGVNWNLAGFLVGLEGDISFADIEGDSVFGGKNPQSDLDWMATLRARGGILVTPDVLVYGTGGVAWGDWSDSFTPLGNAGPRSGSSDTLTGWTVGGGVEAKITETISFKVEYLYVDFGDESNAWSAAPFAGTSDFEHELHTVRAGLNVKLF